MFKESVNSRTHARVSLACVREYFGEFEKCVERISRDSLTSKNVKKSREVYDFEKPQNSGNRKPSFFGFSVTYSDYGVYLEVYSRVRICETRHISSVEI